MKMNITLTENNLEDILNKKISKNHHFAVQGIYRIKRLYPDNDIVSVNHTYRNWNFDEFIWVPNNGWSYNKSGKKKRMIKNYFDFKSLLLEVSQKTYFSRIEKLDKDILIIGKRKEPKSYSDDDDIPPLELITYSLTFKYESEAIYDIESQEYIDTLIIQLERRNF